MHIHHPMMYDTHTLLLKSFIIGTEVARCSAGVPLSFCHLPASPRRPTMRSGPQLLRYVLSTQHGMPSCNIAAMFAQHHANKLLSATRRLCSTHKVFDFQSQVMASWRSWKSHCYVLCHRHVLLTKGQKVLQCCATGCLYSVDPFMTGHLSSSR